MALRAICDYDQKTLESVIPQYDGLPLEEWRMTISNALKEPRRGMPSRLRQVLAALKEVKKIELTGGTMTTPPPMPKKLPGLIKLLTKNVPEYYMPAVASAVFPALGAHLHGVRFRYADNVEHEATLMNVLMAGTGAGKNCIAAPIDCILKDIRERDKISLEKEQQWKEEMQTKGANKDKKKRPEGIIIQEVDADMTNAAFVLRLAEAEEHFLYVRMNEIDQFDALKTSARSKSQFQIMCLAFDPQNSYGTERVGTASVSETVCVRFNWNASTTIQKGKAYFAKVLTDGPISRINFCTIPERIIGSDIPVYGTYDEQFEGELKVYIDRLNAARPDRSRPLLLVIAALTCLSVGYYLWGGTNFDADMRNLGYIADDQAEMEARVRLKSTNGLRSQYFAAGGATMEEALQNFGLLTAKLDSLQDAGLVDHYSQTSKLFIPLHIQQQRIDAWQAYWTDERLATVRQLIARCAPVAGLNPEAFAPFYEAATRTYEPDALYEAGLIPTGYLTTTMEQSYDSSYLCFSTVYCELDSVRSDSTHYHRICDAIANEPNLMVLDTYYYATDTLRQLGQDFDVLQWVSMAFVLLVLLLSFRWNLKIALLCFLPIVISWIIVLGAMNIFHQQFNLINIIISTFIFGIGVDYSIFIMCGLVGSADPKNTKDQIANSQVLKYHKTAIMLSALVLVITVGSMNFATHPAIRSVGFATLVGLISAVVFAYVVEPYIYRKVKK